MDAELVCFNCKHLKDNALGCAAFPDGIPPKITDQGAKHKKPLKGQDNEIVFEPKEE